MTLSRDTVRVLSTDDLARAAGGSGCDTTTWPTKTLQSNGGVAG
ncbi:MAG TPA: hypothetical protein VHW23_15570 [Kofleriaceae bacterium]|nr:hypothetical protein [Kofleriaceae bacterium]